MTQGVGQQAGQGVGQQNGRCPEHGTARVERAPMSVVRWCPCGWEATELVGPQRRGFLTGPGAAPHHSKGPVLRALAEMGQATRSQLVHATGLSEGQVAGVLQRGQRYYFIQRSPEPVLLAPKGRGYLYGLSVRGQQYVAWLGGGG